mmetsp:Transcript_19565/g.42199  ORF Transcript_19565/g.42199 Transcript_19565/m.42199 type:complete len:514 (-) Transcript_19565:44-1585(-)
MKGMTDDGENKKRSAASVDDEQSAKRTKAAADVAPAPAEDFSNEYQGFKLSQSTSIDRVKMSDLTPESFYRDYVAKRKPCVITGCLTDPEWHVSQKWTSYSYLKEKAGGVEIAAEKRTNATDKFGQGNEVKLKFSDFLDLLEAGSDSYYLTTQDVKTDSGGRPHVMAPFMQCLSDDFPIRPKLTGNLIPQNINVWMGLSRDGSSSGLHHDYHDNMYAIIVGRKRFDLYAPSDAVNVYTRGQLKRIHKNGRINYVGEETNADGSHAQAEKALDASICQERAVEELEEAEAALERGDDGAKERLEKAEKALDEAMEAVMDAEEGDDADVGGGDSDGNDDDACIDDEEDFWQAAEKRKMELIEKGDDASPNLNPTKGLSHSTQVTPRDGDYRYDEGHDEDDFAFEGEGRSVDKTVKDPLNFSLVDTALDAAALEENFPRYSEARKATVDIASGDMLYLPASWFHEVTSYGSSKDEKGSGGGHHMAFNYWFHPPDGESFEQPYASSFWPKDWALRKF